MITENKIKHIFVSKYKNEKISKNFQNNSWVKEEIKTNYNKEVNGIEIKEKVNRNNKIGSFKQMITDKCLGR